jgi:hypothetical protein
MLIAWVDDCLLSLKVLAVLNLRRKMGQAGVENLGRHHECAAVAESWGSFSYPLVTSWTAPLCCILAATGNGTIWDHYIEASLPDTRTIH